MRREAMKNKFNSLKKINIDDKDSFPEMPKIEATAAVIADTNSPDYSAVDNIENKNTYNDILLTEKKSTIVEKTHNFKWRYLTKNRPFQDKEEEDQVEEIHNARKVIQHMINRWQKEKEEYISVYGMEDYISVYGSYDYYYLSDEEEEYEDIDYHYQEDDYIDAYY